MSAEQHLELARRLAARFGEHAAVTAVALTGSASSGTADARSDIDLYVYLSADLPVGTRKAIAAPYDDDAEFDNRFWGTADSWHDAATGIRVEGLYWSVGWIEEQIDRVLRRCEPSIGYSTAFWYSVRNGRVLFDRDGWLERLQAEAQQPYPEQLRRAIIAHNYPILRRMSSSYVQQIELAAGARRSRQPESPLHRAAGQLLRHPVRAQPPAASRRETADRLRRAAVSIASAGTAGAGRGADRRIER